MSNNIRVRFAPSPTGTLHIGGARTALYNWLYARKNKGAFVLRLEDTDLSRSKLDSVQGIIDGLKWLGLDWDEGPDKAGAFGPYRQSERLSVYQYYLNKLLEEDNAYYCFCPPEELKSARDEAIQRKTDYKYSGKCGSLSPQEVKHLLQKGCKPVIRLRVPRDGNTVVDDLVRGQVSFENSYFDDFIIARSDGAPTYNFAVVVDDFTMQISHVIRAEEHLSNTPKQIMVYKALDWDLPQFAHVSMILAPDRSKLSKRHGATSVQEFRDQGYLPAALLNYLVLLGWSTGENIDFLSVNEMISRFNLEGISKSPAIYDIQKLTWMNGHYLSNTNIKEILPLVEKQAIERGWLNPTNYDFFVRVIDVVRKRVKLIPEILNESEYFFQDIQSYDEKGINKYFMKSNSIEILTCLLQIVERINEFTADELESALRMEAEKRGFKAAELIHPARLALSGRTATPGLFEIMEILGRGKCRDRISRAREYAIYKTGT